MISTRREFLTVAAAAAAGCSQVESEVGVAQSEQAPYRFRLAICNETFDGWTFADACKGTIRTGYEAIEIGPHTRI